MLSENKYIIYEESFLQPWNEFKTLIFSIQKSTKFLRIVSEPVYIHYYQFFKKEQTKLKYKDCEHALDITELSTCSINYAKFYQFISNIFLKMRDVDDYK